LIQVYSRTQRDRRRFLAVLTVFFLTASLLALYLRSFASIYNSVVTNALVVLLIAAAAITLFLASLRATTKHRTAAVLFAIGLFAFLARAAAGIRLGVPFLHYSYFYAVSMENIYRYGTLSPALGWWYPQVDMELHWPAMQILTVTLSQFSGISPFWFVLYQEPLIGAATAVMVFMLARTVTGRDDLSLIAALFASSSDLLIYYQSEYHPQGFAILVLVLFLYVYLKSRSAHSLVLRTFPLVLAADLVFVHHFSAILIALVAIGFIPLSYFVDRLPDARSQGRTLTPSAAQDATLWVFVAVAVTSYFVFVYFSTLQNFVRLLLETQPNPVLVRQGEGVPLSATVFGGMKWVILLLALFGIAKWIRRANPLLNRLVVIFAVLLAGGAIANFVTGGPTDRLIALYAPVASVLAAVGVREVLVNKRMSRRPLLNTAFACAVAALLVGGILNVPFPAYYFQGLGENPYYWSSDDLSSVPLYSSTGTWITDFAPNGSVFTTEFDTRIVPFYFAHRPVSYIHYLSSDQASTPASMTGGFLLTNPSITDYYAGVPFQKSLFLNASDVVYSNGVLVLSTLQ